MRAFLACVALAACATEPPMTRDKLGALLFSDQNLSKPAGQACADCHLARTAFRDPESDRTTSMGAVAGRFGARNAPTAMYARFVPELHRDADGEWVGGLFWDGRADSLEAQAEGPLLNPLEMNNPDRAAVVATVREASYAPAFRDVFGPRALDDVDQAFAHVTEAIAAFERTRTFAPFSSRYDRYVQGTPALTAAELRGLAVFEDPARGNCASCHPPPLFTTFGYANLGIPRYDNNRFYDQPPPLNPDGARYVDHGLATISGSPVEDGKFRIPTLRNIARTAPYGHNGYFENLPFMLEFLNTRDVGSSTTTSCSRARHAPTAICPWPAPEVPATVVRDAVGHLGLSAEDLDDLYAFLLALTDEP